MEKMLWWYQGGRKMRNINFGKWGLECKSPLVKHVLTCQDVVSFRSSHDTIYRRTHTHTHTHRLTNPVMWGLGLDTGMWGPYQKLLIQLIYSKSAIATSRGSFNRLVSWILIIFKNRISTSHVRTWDLHTYVGTSHTHLCGDLLHTPLWGPLTHFQVETSSLFSVGEPMNGHQNSVVSWALLPIISTFYL